MELVELEDQVSHTWAWVVLPSSFLEMGLKEKSVRVCVLRNRGRPASPFSPKEIGIIFHQTRTRAFLVTPRSPSKNQIVIASLRLSASTTRDRSWESRTSPQQSPLSFSQARTTSGLAWLAPPLDWRLAEPSNKMSDARRLIKVTWLGFCFSPFPSFPNEKSILLLRTFVPPPSFAGSALFEPRHLPTLFGAFHMESSFPILMASLPFSRLGEPIDLLALNTCIGGISGG